MRELFANNATTTLSSSTTSSATTLSVTTGSVFPSTGNFRLIVGSETMLCTARSSNTLTVVMGYESTTAASHASGSTVSQILTVGGLLRNRQDDLHFAGGSQPPVGRLLDASGNVLTSSDFTTTAGVSGSSVTDQAGTLLLTVAAGSGGFNLSTLLRSAPATPYSIQCALQFCFADANSCALWAGLCATDGTKLVTHGLFLTDTAVFEIATSKLVSVTSEDSDYTSNAAWATGLYLWLKVTDDGTNLSFFRSHDGVNWVQSWQVSRTDYLSSVASFGLFYGVVGTAPSNASSATGLVTVAHYGEST